jgi:hypothetical protein
MPGLAERRHCAGHSRANHPSRRYPGGARQIDVSIRRDGSFTLVECRIHKDPQDVTWIEALIGRRLSLKADAVIAVSASGFTKTARDKAIAHGIHLRDFASLSDEEIQNWGRTRTLTLNFCEFNQVLLTVSLSEPPPPGRPRLTDVEGNAPSPVMWRLLYQSIMQKLDQDNWSGVSGRVDAAVKAKLLVNGKPPASILISTKVRRISQTVRLASVFEYADPIVAMARAEVGRYALGDNVAMTIDLSTITVPDSCCFEAVTVNAGRIVKARPRLIGFEQALGCRIPISVRYKFPQTTRFNVAMAARTTEPR